MEKSRLFSTIRLTTAAIASLLSLPLLKFSWSVVDLWIRFWLRPPNAFYIRSWMSNWVLITALAGPFVLFLVVIGVLTSIRLSWPRWPILTLPIAFVVALYGMVVFPNLPLWDAEMIQNSVHLSTVEHSLVEWGRTNGRFPTTQNELLSATARESQLPSIYLQKGHSLNYQLHFLPNQDDPYRTQPDRPGIVYYAVNQTGNQFWLTVSGLNTAISARAVMLQTDPFTASKQPWGKLFVVSDSLIAVQNPKQ